ncbi:class I SAM-dependent methyltransferase [Vibrio sp. SS-MA-C1-2]|uniref:methyltransferase domain-containing protein n=1 Tax=Vibrio sp. SS-MA-C1-2 TaxID=2908646 RepID=UPI001F348A48|nr:methyltransferase domain-containing protein [Vibrio sp. SS-MA-C1-2]UJF20112.1 class I SAM-dependent methyltransferase [Vibrio sp. SS-MA-C1-2]
MKPARMTKKMVPPSSWQELVNGEWVADQLQTRLDEWWPRLFGFHLLKLGGLSAELASCHCSIRHQVCVDKLNPLRNITSELDHLPLTDKSIDACLLAHQLDFSEDPHQLLREVDRVLVADGYLILTGFNPMSLGGLSRFLPWRRKKYPWKGRMFTPGRVVDWLQLLNYEISCHDTFAILPTTKYWPCATWAENLLSDYFSRFGGLYFIVARKRTLPIKPIKSKWIFQKNFKPASANFRVGFSQQFFYRQHCYCEQLKLRR